MKIRESNKELYPRRPSDIILHKTKSIIAKKLGLTRTIEPSERFQHDLGGDSLDMIELVIGLEDDFDIELPPEETDLLSLGITVRELAVLVEQKCIQRTKENELKLNSAKEHIGRPVLHTPQSLFLLPKQNGKTTLSNSNEGLVIRQRPVAETVVKIRDETLGEKRKTNIPSKN